MLYQRGVVLFGSGGRGKNYAGSEWPHPRHIKRGGDYFFFFFFAAFFVAKTLTPLRRSC